MIADVADVADVDLPEAVTRAATSCTGLPHAVSTLSGLSGAVVAEVSGPRGAVVVKGPVGRAEVHVASELAGPLAELGVHTAACLDVVDAVGTWLVLEHLPAPWPRERWGPDPEALAVLRALHGADVSLVASVPDRYEPRWDDSMSDAATRLLGDDVGHLQARAQSLFEPVAVVSADPNPLNWRLDAARRPALVDQGRLTLARPEMDLAILLPGLTTRAEARAVVKAYGHGDPDLVVLAKAWSIVELSTTEAGSRLVAGMAADVRQWLATEVW